MYHQVAAGANKTALFMVNASLRFNSADELSRKAGMVLTLDDQEELATRMIKGFKTEMSLSTLTINKLNEGKHSLKLKAGIDKQIS